MKLEAFRVRNYKRIEDTGWITCRDLIVLVGKNEAGKSAVLRGLSKIKPSDEAGYDGLREFPRHRYTSEFDSQDWPVGSVRLRLDDYDRAQLQGIAPELAEVKTVVVTRHYSGSRTVGFEPAPEMTSVTKATAIDAAEEARKHLMEALAPDGLGEELRVIKEQADAAIQQRVNELPEHGEIEVTQAEALLRAVTQFINEPWQKDCLYPAAEPLREIHELSSAEYAHVNSILLLDEPGTSLHGTAQVKIVEFLRKLSEDSQVIYTAHSPFMIDADRLETIRPVYEEPGTGATRISDDVRPKDKDALFPLQAALGYQLAQSLFISKRQALLEGITDYWIFKSLDYAAHATGREALHPSIILTPSGGASRMMPLASMLLGHEVDVVAVLDGDEPGRREGRKLVDNLLGDASRTIFAGDFSPVGNTAGETEDLFPEDYYLTAVKKAHGNVDPRFTAEEKQIPNIIDRLIALFEREGHGDLEKWKIARALADTIDSDPMAVPAQTLDAATRIFQKINALIGP